MPVPKNITNEFFISLICETEDDQAPALENDVITFPTFNNAFPDVHIIENDNNSISIFVNLNNSSISINLFENNLPNIQIGLEMREETPYRNSSNQELQRIDLGVAFFLKKKQIQIG